MQYRTITPVLLFALLASLAGGQEPAAPTPVTPMFSADVQAELNDLSAADFKTRESAGQKLLARKIEAVDPLLYVIEKGSPEATVRAFELLRQLYRIGDDETNERIEVAFNDLAHNENPTVASRAEAAIEAGTPIRHKKAIAEFLKLGGQLRFSSIDKGDGKEENDALRPIEYAIIDKKWTGGDDGLKYLRRIEDFRIQAEVRGAALFRIKGSKVSDEAIAELQAALPNLVVQPRGPACLGVSPYIPFGGQMELQIHTVKPGSAADRAGLKVGDLLIKFNDHAVPDFETLVEKIGELQPGDKVPVIYERDGVRDTVTVELRGWE